MGLAYLVRDQYFMSRLPDVLREQAAREDIFELQGVQITARASDMLVTAGQVFTVTVVAQNCWDGARTLTVGLKPTRARRGRKLAFAPSCQLSLGAAEVGTIEIPVAVEGSAKPGRYALEVQPRVVGEGGTRVRRRRRRAVPERVPMWKTAMSAALGEVDFGTGLTVSVQVRASGSPVAEPEAFPEPTHTIIWRPDPE